MILVFTDGERNYGRDPMESLAEADAANIRVHLVGVDLDEQIKERPTVQALISAVRGYGGRYYEADTMREAAPAYAQLDTLEKSLVVNQTPRRPTSPSTTGSRSRPWCSSASRS